MPVTLRIYSLFTKYRKVNTRQSMVSTKILTGTTRALQVLAYVSLQLCLFSPVSQLYCSHLFFFFPFNVIKFLSASEPFPPCSSFSWRSSLPTHTTLSHSLGFSFIVTFTRTTFPSPKPRLAHCSICSSPCSLSNHSRHGGEWSCEGLNAQVLEPDCLGSSSAFDTYQLCNIRQNTLPPWIQL